MNASAGLVVIGAGQAAFQLAASARAAGYQERIVLVGAECELPYQRPPLSKAYLLGKTPREGLAFRKQGFFDSNRIELCLGHVATKIDRHDRVLHAGSARIEFDRLVIATGSRNRILRDDLVTLRGVLSLRDLGDADQLADALGHASRIVVIGGGFIGLEVAAAARSLGKEVVVAEAQRRLLGRAVSPQVAAHIQRRHVEMGIEFLFQSMVVNIEADHGRVSAVHFSNGSVRHADLVIVGIGAAVDDTLAADAGLAVSNGIRVDSSLRTTDPAILAIGDCASFPGEDGYLRLESVQNAVDQAKYAAQVIVGAAGLSYRAVPWFWSDQHDMRLQMAGLSLAADQFVMRGNAESGQFSLFAFRRGRLIAVESVNSPADHVMARKMLEGDCRLSPDEAADRSFDLRSFVKSGKREIA